MPTNLNNYGTVLFCDVYEDATDFVTAYNSITMPAMISNANATALYYMLFAKFGNSPISNNDVYQFQIKVNSIIFQYGLTWEKKLAIQASIRGLSDAEIQTGSKTIRNHAYNPSSEASTSSLEDLNYIDDQNVDSSKRGKLESYMLVWEMLEDVSAEFIDKFKVCFKQFVAPERPILYESEDDE